MTWSSASRPASTISVPRHPHPNPTRFVDLLQGVVEALGIDDHHVGPRSGHESAGVEATYTVAFLLTHVAGDTSAEPALTPDYSETIPEVVFDVKVD